MHDCPNHRSDSKSAANGSRFLLLFLCVFASAGQLAIDLYVPALPAMARYFETSSHGVQSSVTVYLVAYALGQLVFGPFSDAYGRKRALALGLALFTIGCVLSLSADSFAAFIVARCLQGFGIAATNLLCKAIITESFTGRAMADAFTYMSTAWGVAPIVAPVIGAQLQTWFGWRSCLWFLLVYSLVMCTLLRRYRETLVRPVPLDARLLMKSSATVLRSPVFQSCFLAQGLCYGILLVFNIVGPFMIQSTLHETPTFFGYLALAMGFMFFLGGLSNRLHHPGLPSAEQRVRIGAFVMMAAAFAMLVLALTVGLRVWTLAAPVLIMALCAGVLYPTLMAKGNSLFPHIAGLTASILAFALLLVSSAMMGLAGFVPVHTLTPLALLFVLLASTVVLTTGKFVRHLGRARQA